MDNWTRGAASRHTTTDRVITRARGKVELSGSEISRNLLPYFACVLAQQCSGLVVEYRTRNREVAGSTHTQSTASNVKQVANLLCAQANSASYLQPDGEMSSSYGYGVKA